MIDEYRQAGVAPGRVWPHSFDKSDILYWIAHDPAFGRQAVYLDETPKTADLPDAAQLADYRAQGIRIVAPPIHHALLRLDGAGRIVPSACAVNVKKDGLEIIAWSLERSGVLADGKPGFFYQGLEPAIRRESDALQVLDVLARGAGIVGMFSDWPAKVTFYANCMGLD